MIDTEIVYKHLKEMEQIILELEDIKKYSVKDISSDLKKQWQIEHGLQLAIQNLLDIGMHLLSSIGKNNCVNYTDVIDKLGNEEIIPFDFAKKIRKMAGLRNILVHDYLDIDEKKIYDIIQNELNDFRTFIRYITIYLDKILS